VAASAVATTSLRACAGATESRRTHAEAAWSQALMAKLPEAPARGDWPRAIARTVSAPLIRSNFEES
jgi:hypothetical protein